MKKDLLDLIDKKLTEAKENEKVSKPKRKPPTRAQSNRANGQNSTGPRTEAGKEKSSTNSLKHGFYAAIDKLHPRDEPNFHQIYGDLRSALHPDGPAEEHLLRELAVFSARLQSLESAQYALIAGHTEGTPTKIEHPEHYTDGDLLDMRQPDAREIAAAYERCLDTLERLIKIETHLRRAYNRAWDRLERMQKDRLKMPLDEMLKRTQAWLNAEARRTNRPQDIPARDSRIDEKGKFHKDPSERTGKAVVRDQEKIDHPMWRPKKGEEDDEIDDKNTKIE